MPKATEALGQRLFTVEEYHRMAEAGVFAEDDRVELVGGVVRKMSPKNRDHSIAVWKIKGVFDDGLRGRAATFSEAPIALESLHSEPEPDIAVMSTPDGELFGTAASEPLLVIEVSDSSLRYDLTDKAALYAAGQIPEYWVVDLVHRELIVFRDPRNGAYQRRETLAQDARVAPWSWPDLGLDVRALFPAESESSS